MCTNPILIKNRKFRHMNCETRSSYIKVPCGRCDECLSDLANDLYVRARYEYLSCLENGGIGFMCCLTYSNELLPYFEGKMVFNKQHIIDFIKRLRIRLTRAYMSTFGFDAPKFKYLVTCEYGTDPTKSHRPHYHMLVFFKQSISYSLFRECFSASLSICRGKDIIPVFGKIFQCDILDSTRGGIKYSGKYVLKDLMYEPQRISIMNKIKFYTDYVNNIFNIIPFPHSSEEELFNSSIRSSKAYRKAVSKYVLPYRHMLQFYMLSNDLGVSAIIRKYGEDVLSLPCLNFEGFPYKFPKSFKRRISENYGNKKSDELSRKVFINYLSSCLDVLVVQNKIVVPERDLLLDFANKYIYPLHGTFYLVNPLGLNPRDCFDNPSLVSRNLFLSDCEFFCDNDFYELRCKLMRLMSLFETKEFLDFRASLRYRKVSSEKIKYEKRRRNNPVNLYQ